MVTPPRLPPTHALSNDDWRLLVESVQEYAIFMLDPHGNVVSWNRGAEKIKGYRADEIIGKHFSAFYPGDQRDMLDGELEAVRRLGRVEREGWRIRKDGSRFWADVVITALRDDHGELRGFAKVTRDLTARRAAEEELRRSEERFRLLIEAVSDYALYMLDPQGDVTTWNAGAQAIKGYTASEIIGKNYALFFPESDRRSGKPQRELEIARTQGRFEEEGVRVRKDGTEFRANVVLTPVRDAHGVLLGFAKVTRDLTARLRAEQTARELVREQAARAAAQASEERIRDSEERYRALSRRLEVILEGIADGITVQDRSGQLIFANSAAARATGFATLDALLRSGPQQFYERFELRDERGAPLERAALPGPRALAGEGPSSLVVQVRDIASGRTFWLLVRATAVQGTDGKPELAVNILHDITEDRRRELHDRYLAQASAALSESLDYTTMLDTLAKLLVPGLADWCTIHLLEGESLRSVAVAHADAGQVAHARQLARRCPADARSAQGIWSVARSGRAELYAQVSDAMLSAAARDEEHLALLRGLGVVSALVVPIRAQGRVLGTITLMSAESQGQYDANDLALAEELGRRAGTSIENARLYAAEKRARDQVALLARGGESFSSSSNYEDMLRSVVQITLPTLGDFAFFDLVERDGMRRLAAAHEDTDLDALIESTSFRHSGRSDKNVWALSGGASGFHPYIDAAWRAEFASSAEELALLERLALCSLITVPLRARGEVLGALTVCFGKSGRHHTLDDLQLSEELARRAALGVVQARLYTQSSEAARSAEQAAERAEEANRLKDEFLATLSHELRTPLNAILGWASILRARNGDGSAAKGLEVIHRNAQAQAKIIDDILDVSRIITGKLRLELKPTDMRAIVCDAIEVVRPSALAKRLALAFEPPREPCLLIADPERLQQVVWNLLSNAVKFCNADGKISVKLEREGGRLALSVADSGQGIEPEFLPHVFERFRQADSSATRRIGGLGLGLAIVRHLVELHGGEVVADSTGRGRGATFTVKLPVRAVASARDEASHGGGRASATPPPHHKLPLAGTKVVVVDDEPDARELLADVLLSAGAIVDLAASADEGFAAVRRVRPDVLISDIGMPDEDGYSLVRRVRALEPSAGGRIPSLALTAYARSEDKAKALAMGFTTHLAKPIHPDELVAAVTNLAPLARR